MVKRCARDKVAEKLNQNKTKFDKKCYKELLEKKNSTAETDAVFQMCSVQKAFLKIWQNSQENTCVRVFFLIKFFLKKS